MEPKLEQKSEIKNNSQKIRVHFRSSEFQEGIVFELDFKKYRNNSVDSTAISMASSEINN